MTLRLLISLSLLLLAWQKVCAQVALPDDFFNGGAQLYISNNIPAALERTESGLKIYPNDEKLKKLEQLLKQQQQQQQQQNQQNQSQQQQKNQQQQNQQNQNQQSSQQNSQDQQKQDEEKKKEAEQQKQDQQKQQDQQQQQSAQKKDGEKQDKQDEQGQPVKAGEMTPEEARRLLDAQKGDEQLLQMKPKEKPQDMSHPIKDW